MVFLTVIFSFCHYHSDSQCFCVILQERRWNEVTWQTALQVTSNRDGSNDRDGDCIIELTQWRKRWAGSKLERNHKIPHFQLYINSSCNISNNPWPIHTWCWTFEDWSCLSLGTFLALLMMAARCHHDMFVSTLLIVTIQKGLLVPSTHGQCELAWSVHSSSESGSQRKRQTRAQLPQFSEAYCQGCMHNIAILVNKTQTLHYKLSALKNSFLLPKFSISTLLFPSAYAVHSMPVFITTLLWQEINLPMLTSVHGM